MMNINVRKVTEENLLLNALFQIKSSGSLPLFISSKINENVLREDAHNLYIFQALLPADINAFSV